MLFPELYFDQHSPGTLNCVLLNQKHESLFIILFGNTTVKAIPLIFLGYVQLIYASKVFFKCHRKRLHLERKPHLCKKWNNHWLASALELRQYKNDYMDWKKVFVLNLPSFFARLIGERKNAANSKQRKNFSPLRPSCISLALVYYENYITVILLAFVFKQNDIVRFYMNDSPSTVPPRDPYTLMSLITVQVRLFIFKK